MDAIKKKMQSLKSETDNAALRAEELDKEAKEATQRAEKYEENVREMKLFLVNDKMHYTEEKGAILYPFKF